MNKDGAVAEITDIAQCFNKIVNLMARDGADIFKFQGLEKHAGREEAFEAFFTFFQNLEDILAYVGEGF